MNTVNEVNGYDDLSKGISLIREKIATCVIVKAGTRKLKDKDGNKETRSDAIDAAKDDVSNIGGTIPPKVDLWLQAKRLSSETA